MRLPPLIGWYQHLFETHFVLALMLGIVVAVVAVLLFRFALKVFVLFLILALLALGVSYLLQGEDETERALREGIGEEQAAPGGEGAPPAPDASPAPAPASEPKKPR